MNCFAICAHMMCSSSSANNFKTNFNYAFGPNRLITDGEGGVDCGPQFIIEISWALQWITDDLDRAKYVYIG